MSLAPSSLAQLDSACELFSKAARGFRANKVLVPIMSLNVLVLMNLTPWTGDYVAVTKQSTLES